MAGTHKPRIMSLRALQHEIDIDKKSASRSSMQVDSDEVLTVGRSVQQQKANWNEPLYRQALQRLTTNCIVPVTDALFACHETAYKSCLASDREEFEWILSGLLKDIKRQHNVRSPALHKLYRLTDREHMQNRIPAICSTSFATIQTLVTCLKTTTLAPDRRYALLIINNLCIPMENKAAIMFGEACEPLLNALLALIRNRSPDSYLALVCLVNLSYLHDDHAKTTLCNFVPVIDNNAEADSLYTYKLPGDDPSSLIRTIESLLKEYVPYVYHTVNSVEHQCCRWSMNLIRNLVTLRDLAVLVGTKTIIPAVAVTCLSRADPNNLQLWTHDSLEDACLMILVHVCAIDDNVQTLYDNQRLMNELRSVCTILRQKVGIHQTRAAALSDRLDEMDSCQSTGYSV